MRATTCWIPKLSRATRAAMMLELSPLETAANASASSMPARSRTVWSNPMPVTFVPLKEGPRRRNASGLLSMIETSCRRSSRDFASVEPTRPQPMMTTCTGETLLRSRVPTGDSAKNPRAVGLALPIVGVGDVFKRVLLGRKLRSTQLGETLLPKRIALPVFASDALSSVAYAPDEVFIMLSVAGVTAYAWSLKIAVLVAVVMLTVVASYRQNVHAYPSGGGDYEVATVNLGGNAGVTVASALLVDYVLTVAVSISSGVQNAASAITWIQGRQVEVAVFLVVLLAALNLRGVRESGAFFAVPTYGFMVGVIGMAIVGALRGANGSLPDVESAQDTIVPAHGYPANGHLTGLALVFLLARAFSSGSAALTGVEAISNGVPAFRKPKSKNAATTLLPLGTLSITMLMSIIILANKMGLKYVDDVSRLLGPDHKPVGQDFHQPTVMAQLSKAVFDNFPPGFYFVLAVTGIILVLAANTAFNGFPVLGSILARDGYMPRALGSRGDPLRPTPR